VSRESDGFVLTAHDNCYPGPSNNFCEYDYPIVQGGAHLIEIEPVAAGALGEYTLLARGPGPVCSYALSPPSPVNFGTTSNPGECLIRTVTVSSANGSGCWPRLGGSASASPAPFTVPFSGLANPSDNNASFGLSSDGDDTVEIWFCPSSPGTYAGSASFTYSGYPGRPSAPLSLAGTRQ
jgi:hypothetical protein